MGQLGEIKSWFERSLKISEKRAQADANDAQAQRDLSISLERLARVSGQQQHFSEAVSFQRRALDISRTLAAAFPLSAELQRTELVHRIQLADLLATSNQQSAVRTEAAADLLTKLRPRLPKHDSDNLDHV